MSEWRKLPLTFDDYEMKGEWRRCIKREGTVGELAEEGMWDVDDPADTAEMTQVLRLLRDSTQQLAALVEAARAVVKEWDGWNAISAGCISKLRNAIADSEVSDE